MGCKPLQTSEDADWALEQSGFCCLERLNSKHWEQGQKHIAERFEGT
jgi:hypothetical protein